MRAHQFKSIGFVPSVRNAYKRAEPIKSMRKAILLAVLIATVIIAGCAGKDNQQPAGNQPAASGGQATVPTTDVSAIDSGANSVDTGLNDLDSTQAELDSGISDADLNLGI